MHGISISNLNKRVQNSLTRIVFKRPHSCLQTFKSELHWLHLHHRIDFKIVTLTFEALPSLSIVIHTPLLSRIRSHSTFLQPFLDVKPSLVNFSAPSVWNSIPIELRTSPPSFKRRLKLYFFTHCSVA